MQDGLLMEILTKLKVHRKYMMSDLGETINNALLAELLQPFCLQAVSLLNTSLCHRHIQNLLPDWMFETP